MYRDLELSDRARVIALAVKSGITDLDTIEKVYNTFSNGGNIYKYETGGPKGTSSIPISVYLKKLAKDAAYKIAVDDEIMRRGNAAASDIVRALITKKEDILEDDNKRAYIYGTGNRYPEVKEPIQGFDYSNYFKKVGYKDIKDVYGTINPEGAYHIDEEYEPLLRALAEHNYHFYDNADDMFLESDPESLGYRDDVGNFIHQLGIDKNGNIVMHDSDVYDFYPGDYNYTRGAGTKATKIQARLMEMIGTPYTIRQENQPVVFDGNFGQAAWNITNHLDDLTTEDIAKATQSGVVPESIVVAAQKAFGGNLLEYGGEKKKYKTYAKQYEEEQRAKEAIKAQFPVYKVPDNAERHSTSKYGAEYYDVVNMHYHNLMDTLRTKGIPYEDALRLAPILTMQLIREGDWRTERPDNNFGGMRVNNRNLEFDDLSTFYNAYIDNLDEKWGESRGDYYNWRNSHDYRDYSKRVNRDDLRLNTQEKYDAYNKEHQKNPVYLYAPEWNNGDKSYEHLMGQVRDRTNHYMRMVLEENPYTEEMYNAPIEIPIDESDKFNLSQEQFQALLGSHTKKEGGPIHIKPENRGKFTALKKRTGHSASWFKAHGTPAQKKMATFALNAKKWHH